MRLSDLEKETIIRFNEEEETAVILTYNLDWKKKLEKLSKKTNYVRFIRKVPDNGVVFEVPKVLVTLADIP
ncbi:hypothetical protein [Caldanaerobacter subterraneus]|uniref:hypothetical protein n=1 Tax=Caldanaerobacter subterraneus TaxID=911092 RepID=UPI0019F7E58F|nr:hypothetical protein [Caldanaerobacter subterraneus]